MCTPTASIAGQGAGAASQAVGAYYQAQGQRSNLRFQAEMAEINAKTTDLQAAGALLAGQREEQRSRLSTAGLKGAQQAKLAASGVDLGEGSAVRILTSTDVMGEIDANTIAANAVRAAWGYRTEATNQRSAAASSRMRADAISPGTAVATSLLGSGTQVAASWYQMNKTGAFETERLNNANASADPLGTYGDSKGWW